MYLLIFDYFSFSLLIAKAAGEAERFLTQNSTAVYTPEDRDFPLPVIMFYQSVLKGR